MLLTSQPQPRFSPASYCRAVELQAPAPAPGRDFRTFLLEDNPANAFVIESYLDELDLPPPMTVCTIADAYAHKQDIVAGTYDLVICDIMLPDGESFRFMADLISNGFDRIALYSARGRSLSSSLIDDIARYPNFAKPLDFRSFRAGIKALMEGC